MEAIEKSYYFQFNTCSYIDYYVDSLERTYGGSDIIFALTFPFTQLPVVFSNIMEQIFGLN